MPWFRVDDGFHSHPKVLATSLAARGLWATAGSWSSDHLTDGFVPGHVLASLNGTPELAEELVTSGLWKRRRGGYQFHDWAKKNPSRTQVERAREKNRARQKAWQEAHANAVSNAVTNAVTNSAPVPVPVPSSGTAVTEPSGRHHRPVENPHLNSQSRPGDSAAGRHPSAKPLAAALADAGVNGGKPAAPETMHAILARARQTITQEATDA